VRFTTSHPRDFVKEIVDVDRCATQTFCAIMVHLPVQSGSTSGARIAMQRLYTRDAVHAPHRVDEERAARHCHNSTDIIVGFPGETEEDFGKRSSLLDEVGYDSLFSFKYSRRPNTASAGAWAIR
jgi:tRNA-2-methylthio-N6-dimethylallyladenosine synthase